MSIHRHAAKRDSNEPAIRKRFAHHGWHTEQMNGAGMPDLLAWPSSMLASGGRHLCFLVDVKTPTGKVTPAQEEKWKALAEKGIPVYVVRTAADVDALVRGELAAWHPHDERQHHAKPCAKRLGARPVTRTRFGTPTPATYTPPRSKPVDRRCPKGCGKHGWDTTNERTWRCADCGQPPDTAPVDAAKVAEETFAAPKAIKCRIPGCPRMSKPNSTTCVQHEFWGDR